MRSALTKGHRVVLVIEWGESPSNLDVDRRELLSRVLQVSWSLYFEEWSKVGHPTMASSDFLFSHDRWKCLVISHQVSSLKSILEFTFRDFPVSLHYHSPVEFAEVALGRTTHFMIYDLMNGAHPNTMGRILETISGTGLLIIFCRTLEEYEKLVDPSVHDFVLQFPRGLDEITPIFFPYLRQSLERLDPLVMNDLVSLSLESESVHPSSSLRPSDLDMKDDFIVGRQKSEWIPLTSSFRGHPVTSDQLKVLTFLDETIKSQMANKKRKRMGHAIFLSSKRGRGKSTVLGLILGSMVLESPPLRPHVITAPHVENVQVVFRALLSFLRLKGVECRPEYVPDSEMVRGILLGRRLVIKYRDPIDALKEKGSLIVVDEAGSIPIPLLKSFLKKFDLVLFSSTEHGYEGTGRSFTFRFQKELEAENRLLAKVMLKQPVRHGNDDPLESWLHDVLLLDAEPPDISVNPDEIDLSKLELVSLDKRELFFQRIDLLRDIVGILVSSHYRNQPNDLFLMAEAPHVRIHGVFYPDLCEDADQNGNDEEGTSSIKDHPRRILVAAVLSSIEGGFDPKLIPLDPMKQRSLRGNVVTLTMFRTVQSEFPRWKGSRIVRIAVHPSLQGRKIGSETLYLFERACQKEGLEWVGTSFGATPRLINFWKKNGYQTVHLRPTPSSTTGECSIIMIKPLVGELESLVTDASRDLRFHVLHWTRELWWYFEPEEILAFIDATTSYHGWKPIITNIGLYRLDNYLNKTLTYFGVMGVVNQLTWHYFLKYPEVAVHLAPIQRKILVVKNLQGWDWNSVAAKFRSDPSKIQGLYVKALKRLRKWFLSTEMLGS